MSWLIDGHVHYHECFGWERFLSGAAARLDEYLAAYPDRKIDAGCLLFVDLVGEQTLDRLQELWKRAPGHSGSLGSLPGKWNLTPTGESTALLLERADGPPLVLVQGRQVATREGLEVLAISCAIAIPDRHSLDETVAASLESGAVTVIPWGFGKWWAKRGTHVRRLLEAGPVDRIFLGDNGNRPAHTATPRLFELARERGVSILPGSDPLPFPHHAQRGLSYGFSLAGALDRQRPGASLRDRLQELRESPPVFGHLCGLPLFVTDQLRMQLRLRLRRSSASSPPDVTRTEAS